MLSGLTASRLRAVMLACALAALAGGCSLPDFMSFPPQVRGNKVEADQLKELVPGTSTRADAISLIGSPTARATFDDNVWLYIAEVTKPLIGATNEVRDQQVIVLTFDTGGTLRDISRKGADDAVPVTVAARTTPAPGSDASVLQQLLGNVGRFSTGGGTTSTSAASRSLTGGN